MDGLMLKIKKYLPFAEAAFFALAIFTLHRELDGTSIYELRRTFAQIPAHGVMMAAAAVVMNYFLLTLNDMFSVRASGGSLPYVKVAPVSFVSNAVGFSLGASAISGGAIRYRLYSMLGLGTWQIGRIIALTQLPFIFGPFVTAIFSFCAAPEFILESPVLTMNTRLLLALVCIAVPTAGLCAGFMCGRGRKLKLRNLEFSIPGPKELFSKYVIGLLDVATAAMVLFAVMPGHGMDFPTFLAAFAVASLLGVLSQVPGGLGVFDATLIMLLAPVVSQAEVLSAVLIYRFMYFVVPLMCATAVLLAIGLNGKLASKYFGRIYLLLPDAAALWTFLAGAWLLVSTASPTAMSKLARLETFVPLTIFEASQFLRSLIGTALLFLAWGIAKRLKSAWKATVSVLCFSLALALVSPTNPVRVVFFLSLLAVLFLARKNFYRLSFLSNPDRKWAAAIVMAGVTMLWWGLFSYKSLKYSSELWWTFAFESGWSRFLRAATAMTLTMAVAFLFLWLRPARFRPSQPSREKIKALVNSSEESDAALALLGDKKFFLSADGTSAIMYAVSGAFWIAMGDPIGTKERKASLIWNFCEMADMMGAHSAFYEVGSEWLHVYREIGLKTVPIGDDARTDVSGMPDDLSGPQWRKLRSIRNHVTQKDDLSFRVLTGVELDAMMPKLKTISDEWLTTVHGKEKGFSLGFFSETYLRNFPVAVAEKDGEPLAFCNLWMGGGDEFSVDLMRYSGKAPNDIMSWLFIETMLWGKAQGYRYFRLGMAPLSNLDPHNSLWEKCGDFIFEHGEHFYNFKGLRQYKEKFNPTWRRRYIVYKDTRSLPAIVSHLVRLVSKKQEKASV